MRYTTFTFLLVFVLFTACDKETSTPLEASNDIILKSSASVKVIQDQFEGTDLVVVANTEDKYAIAFDRMLDDGTLLDLQALPGSLPLVMIDQENNKWDIFGYAVEGPRTGQRLNQLSGYKGFWFAWAAMFPETTLFDGTPPPYEYSEDSIPLHLESCTIHNLGSDDIVALDVPEFEKYQEKDAIENGYFINDEDYLIGVCVEGQYKLYPRKILNYYEIINDEIEDISYSVTFCPLTATGVTWNREVNDDTYIYGISGQLFNSNLMPFDRKTRSLWSQMSGKCLRGENTGLQMLPVQSMETTWKTWKKIISEPSVLSIKNLPNRDYDVNPYEDYLKFESIPFPVAYDDYRLPNREEVFGIIINGKAKVYTDKDLEL